LLELTSETVKAKNILDELRGKIRAAIEANKRSLLE